MSITKRYPPHSWVNERIKISMFVVYGNSAFESNWSHLMMISCLRPNCNAMKFITDLISYNLWIFWIVIEIYKVFALPKKQSENVDKITCGNPGKNEFGAHQNSSKYTCRINVDIKLKFYFAWKTYWSRRNRRKLAKKSNVSMSSVEFSFVFTWVACLKLIPFQRFVRFALPPKNMSFIRQSTT